MWVAILTKYMQLINLAIEMDAIVLKLNVNVKELLGNKDYNNILIKHH